MYFINFVTLNVRFSSTVRYATFFIEFQSYLKLSQSSSKVPMLTVYEFRLNYAKSQQSRHFGHCGTGTTLIGTGIDLVLLGGTGTACIGTGTDWLLYGGIGTASKVLPKNVIFAHFWYHFSSFNFSIP